MESGGLSLGDGGGDGREREIASGGRRWSRLGLVWSSRLMGKRGNFTPSNGRGGGSGILTKMFTFRWY